jgi:hypothetical protein
MPHGMAGREMETSASPRATITGEVDRITGLEETLTRELLALMQRTRLALMALIIKRLILERALPLMLLVEI